MKTLLIITALVLSLIATNCSAIPYFKSNLTTAQYGVFKLLSDKNSTVGITQAQKLNVNISHHQAWNIHGNSYQDYFKLYTPQQKALFTYQYLIKVAAQVDFIADIREDHHKRKSLRLGSVDLLRS